MTFRVAVGGIEHESSSFIPEPTPLDEFARHLVRGRAIERLGEANTIVDGFVQGVRECGLELVPLIWAEGTSGGRPTLETLLALEAELLDALGDQLPVDGVLLSLHGSFAAEEVDDADGHILQAVRRMVGPGCPIMAVHDMHSNISAAMVEAADALVIERTYPHTDMAERARHTAALMRDTLSGSLRPTMAFRPLPLLWGASKMITGESPMRDCVARLEALDREPAIVSASVGVGYQWIDHPLVGAATVVVANGDRALAQRHADELAGWIWDRRRDWQHKPLSLQEALEHGEALGRYPIVLADQADNTGGGAPGDSTEILRVFVERRLQDAAVLYMVDPQVAAIAKAAGVGAVINVEMGGKSHPLVGPPVPMRARVLAVSDGRFTYDGPMWKGVEEHMGNSALVRQEGVYVIVTSERRQPIDLALPRSLGLDCRTLRTICVKSTGHFRSGFGPIAGSIYNVDAAGLFTHDFRKLPYTRLGRKVYPLDADAEVAWTTG